MNNLRIPISDINFSDDINQFDLRKVTLKICKETVVASKGLYIEDSAISNAQNTIYNKPILCAYEITDGEKTDFKGHAYDYNLVIENNEYRLEIVYEEQPIGVIPESCDFRKEEVDGEMWYVADGYIYSKYCSDAINIIENNSNKKYISMEIRVEESNYNETDKLTHITKFSFTGVTILGEKHNPAIVGASIEMFSENENFSNELNKIIKEVSEINNNSIFENKGGTILNKKEIIDKYKALLKDNKDFEAITSNEKLSIEDLEKQLFELSYSDIRKEIRNQINSITYVEHTSWGETYEYRKWYVEDVLINNIVILEDNEHYGTYYGAKFTINGDSVVVDINSMKRYKTEWREFQEGETVPTPEPNPVFEEKMNKAQEKIDSINAEFESTKNELNEIKAQVVDLQTKNTELEESNKTLEATISDLEKKNAEFETKKKESEVDKVLEQYEELSSIEGYEELVKNKLDFSTEELTTKLKVLAYDNGIILGKNKGKQKNEKGLVDLTNSNVNFENDDNNAQKEKTAIERRYGDDISNYINN